MKKNRIISNEEWDALQMNSKVPADTWDASQLNESFPNMDEIESERRRLKDEHSWKQAMLQSLGILLVVAAIAVLISMLYLPTLRVTGNSMEPTLMSGDIIVGVKELDFDRGDICCFYYNNKILLKRVIATPGQQVVVDDEGYVYVNGTLLEEPYVYNRSLGTSDLKYPVTVPEENLFVMGDHRDTSVDSRSSLIGFVSKDLIVGKMLFRVWPLSLFGSLR